MSTMTPVDKNSALWRAWVDYIATEDFANAKLWATAAEHTEGSLWAAFMAGHQSSSGIAISGVWLRREGEDAVVLVEIDGEWRRVIVERVDGSFSHIAERGGIENAPKDTL